MQEEFLGKECLGEKYMGGKCKKNHWLQSIRVKSMCNKGF